MRNFTFVVLHLFGVALSSLEIKIEEEQSTDWESARRVCQIYKQLLLPDFGDGFFSLPQIPVDRFFWINAKTLNVSYPGSFAYLKYALYPDSDSNFYLCNNKEKDEIIWKENSFSWNKSQEFCQLKKMHLLNLSKPSEIRRAISVLQKDKPAWLENVTDYNLPSLESSDQNISESCVGIVKLQSGKVLYQKDNCSSSHKYFCVHLGVNLYAPTLTKLSAAIDYVSEEYLKEGPPTTIGETGDVNAAAIASASGGVCLVLVIVGIVVTRSVLVRKRSQEDYLKRLDRYKQRQGTLPKSNTGNRTLTRPYVDTLPPSQIPPPAQIPESYEECQNERYAGCQKDVVEECGRMLRTRYSPDPVSQTSITSNNRQDAYYKMDAEEPVKVLQSYEHFDPDVAHLQKAQGYINQPANLSDLDTYENLPADPRTLPCTSTSTAAYSAPKQGPKTFPKGKQQMAQSPISVPKAKGALPPKTPPKKKGKLSKVPTESFRNEGGNKNVTKTDADSYSLDQYESPDILQQAVAGTDKNKHLANAEQEPANLVDALDQYENLENFDLPPKRDKAEYWFKLNTKRVAVVDLSGVDDYESYDQITDRKAVTSIDELDPYENLDNV